MSKYIKSLFLFLLLVSVCFVIATVYSLNIDKTVFISINNICVDDDYLNTAYIDYSTEGKKVVSFDINIKNYSFSKIKYLDIINKNIDTLTTGDQIEDEQITELSIFNSKTIPCHILVDKNINTKDLKKIISESEVEVIKYNKNDGRDGSYYNLIVDEVSVGDTDN